MQDSITKLINESIQNFSKLSEDKSQLILIEEITNVIINSFENGNKLLICGNGGSAADAQHIAAELSGRFEIDRKPLNACLLYTSPSPRDSV